TLDPYIHAIRLVRLPACLPVCLFGSVSFGFAPDQLWPAATRRIHALVGKGTRSSSQSAPPSPTVM
ncbi:hypothetical protein BKA81DRAFT_360820, partial [Phyllosticta paracitricarpa]